MEFEDGAAPDGLMDIFKSFFLMLAKCADLIFIKIMGFLAYEQVGIVGWLVIPVYLVLFYGIKIKGQHHKINIHRYIRRSRWILVSVIVAIAMYGLIHHFDIK